MSPITKTHVRISAAITAALMASVLCFARAFPGDTRTVTLRLIDAKSRNVLPGLVRITDAAGRVIRPPELLSRGLGLETGATAESPIHGWSTVTGPVILHLPAGRYAIEALAGLETESARQPLDLFDRREATLDIPLARFSDLHAGGWYGGNTHLHLARLTRGQSDRYLAEVPRADGLDALFVSYLERAGSDHTYISNTYRLNDLQAIGRRSGVRFGNGEEHRHNFAGGEGYGHVMFLNLKQLVQPVSLGPDIARNGTDGIPLRRGIDAARRQPACVVWCHNDWGRERIPSLVAGRLDAMNVFDGSIRDAYEEGFYRDLNAGFRIPLSTGTDWFLYDFSRVYVRLQGEPTVENWLKSLSAGRTFITNGPLLDLRVAGKTIGDLLAFRKPTAVRVEGRGVGRSEFGQIELIRNGAVVAASPARRVGGHFEANIVYDLKIDSPCWLALRTPPPPPDTPSSVPPAFPRNEIGRNIFAHTSAIYIEFAGRHFFDLLAAQAMLADMQASQDLISKKGMFADRQGRARVLDVYAEAIDLLKKRIANEERS